MLFAPAMGRRVGGRRGPGRYLRQEQKRGQQAGAGAGLVVSDTDTTLYNQQQAVFYITLTFHGELQLEERPND